MGKNCEAVRRIIQATNNIDGVYYYFAKHLGINENTLAFLYALDDGRPHSQKEISDEWLIPRTTINTIVKSLVAAGYITFDPEQRTKEKTIILTQSGRSYTDGLLRTLYAAEERAIESTLERSSPEFISALEDFSRSLHDELDRIMGEKRQQAGT